MIKNNNQTPLLSVIVPVYNTEKYINRCIDSILNQTYKNLEIIVVDDASQGDIKEIAGEFCKKHSNVRLISHEKNRGLFQARITGLKEARGDFFAFVDSDDYIAVDYYRVMIDKALLDNADIVVADYLEYLENEKCFYNPNGMLHQVDWHLKDKEIIDMLMAQKGLDYSWWVVWNKIYSINIWNKTKDVLKTYSDHIIMCEDVAFSVAFLSNAHNLVNTHHNYYYYYRNQESASVSESITYEKYLKTITDFSKAFDIAKLFLKKNGQWEKNQYNWEIWFGKITEIWINRVMHDSKLKKHQLMSLRSLLDKNPTLENETQCDRSADFCCHGTKWYEEDWFNDIKKAISSDKCKIVSFDVFDTLIQRPFIQPTDLFKLLDSYVNQIVQCTDYIVFTDIRVRAEAVARDKKRVQQPNWEEVSLDDIYIEVGMLCPDFKPYLEKIKVKEIELEQKYCQVRKSGKELFDCARACGKRVICTSDMYLPKAIITGLLSKNGIYPDVVYVSSELGITKSSGSLYGYVIKKEHLISGAEMVHIGDNWHSDVENAKSHEIRAYHLPKAIDIYCGHNHAINGGNTYKIFHEKKGLYAAASGNEYWGSRCMQAIIANKIFDNPFVIFDRGSDYNANAYYIGYQALGMNTFATADWLMHSVIDEKYQNLAFMARDGFLPLNAFNKLNKVYRQDINTHYLYLSRKAIFPLMLRKKEDYYALFNTFGVWNMTPERFLKIVEPIMKKESIQMAENICNHNHVAYNKPFDTIEGFMNFGELFFSIFFDKERSEKYQNDMKTYLDKIFVGKSATFDVGYNGRCESTLKQNYGYDITAHYIHINSDRPLDRVRKTGIKLKTLYPHNPFITGIMREQLMSEMVPSCIGYGYSENGKFQPQFEDEYSVNFQTFFVTKTIQNAALDFVTDMVETFGDDLKLLDYRYYDACMPLETYLSMPTPADQNIWSGTIFEDDMGIGNNKSLVDFWNHELHRWGSEPSNRNENYSVPIIDYDTIPFIRRWCLIFGFDWGEGKRRFYHFTENHRILRAVSRKVYISGRHIYRIFKR